MSATAWSQFKAGVSVWRPRHGATLAGIALAALAYAYMLGQQTPVGSVEGQVVMYDNLRPLPGATIFLSGVTKGDDDSNGSRSFDTTAGSDGRFTFTRVPAGLYRISASSTAHKIGATMITVDEGGRASVSLMLQRSQPELSISQHQHIFGTDEQLRLPVQGYVDGRKPRGEDTVRVTLYRTRLATVLKERTRLIFESMSQPVAAGRPVPQALIGPSSGARSILNQDQKLAQADREDFYYQRLAFGQPGPGLYLVDLAHGKAHASTWLLVTNTALVVKRAAQQVTAYTVDMKSGVPVGGFTVRAYRKGAPLAQGQTDSQGIAQFNLPAEAAHPDYEDRIIIAADNGHDEASIYTNFYGNEDEGSFVVHSYTDRPIYRPGQRIYYKGIVRRVVERGRRYSVPANEPVTVEVRDPSGERILREQRATNDYGSFSGQLDLSPETPTGGYSLIATVGGRPYTSDIMVAAYRKPEFQATVTMARPQYLRGQEIEGTIVARYYFDAPVAGAKAHYEVYRRAEWYGGYGGNEEGMDEGEEGDAGSTEVYGDPVTRGDVYLDENGQATIRFPASVPASEDMQTPQIFGVSVTVKDDAGREVTAQASTRVTAGDFALEVQPDGYLATPGQPSRVMVQAADYQGRPVANQAIELESGYSAWKQRRYTYTVLGKQSATTGPDGRAFFDVTPPRSGQVKLTARAFDSGHRAISRTAELWASGDDGGDLDTEYNDLSIMTDRRQYAPGDTARVLINASRTGQSALVTVESNRVHRVLVVPLTKHSTVLRIPVLAEYGPNVYLAACYVQKKHFAESQTSLRVTMPQSEVMVRLTPDQTSAYRPGGKITYRVETTDAKGRPAPCELSLGVVDESIYALREDDPKALRRAFYPRMANSVGTSYSFEILYLGDADKTEPNITTRKRFLDTAFWQPSLQTDAGGHASVSFTLPDNLTTWRATAVAATRDSAFGRETSKVVVSKPFFVRVEMPRFLTSRDRSQLSVFVHNQTREAQTALVRLRVEGLGIEGDALRTVSVQPGQSSPVTWGVTAGDGAGAKVTVTAWTPRVAGKPQYTDGVEMPLAIKPHGREVVSAVAGTLTAANPETEVMRMDPAAIPSATRITVRIAPSLTGSMLGGLDYLVGYPYGCTEQTMSRFLPDILVQRALRARGMRDAKLETRLPAMVRDGLTRLYRFQHPSGGWGWWQYDEDDPWMTAYVLYGLGAAKEQGYPVSKNVLARATKRAIEMSHNIDAQRKPFLLYALARAGEKDVARIERGRIQLDGLGSEALAYLALCDRYLGGPPPGASPLDALARKSLSADGMLHWYGHETRFDYLGDDVTATAAALRAMIVNDPHDARIGPTLRWLMSQRIGDNWSSTEATSSVLAVLCDYLVAFPGAGQTTGEVRLLLNGRPYQTFALTPENLGERELVARIPASDLRAGKNDVTLERAGGTSPVFYSVEMRQVTAAENIPAFSSAGLTVRREYLRLVSRKDGAGQWSLQSEPTDDRLQQGDPVLVRLVINTPRDMAYVLIEDPYPSGCEVNDRGDALEQGEEWSNWWSSTDVRDDHIAFFARQLSKGKHVIEYRLRAQTPGAYHALPALVEGMYAPDTRAETAETVVTVQ